MKNDNSIAAIRRRTLARRKKYGPDTYLNYCRARLGLPLKKATCKLPTR